MKKRLLGEDQTHCAPRKTWSKDEDKTVKPFLKTLIGLSWGLKFLEGSSEYKNFKGLVLQQLQEAQELISKQFMTVAFLMA